MARRSLIDTVKDPNAKEAFIKEGSKKPVLRSAIKTSKNDKIKVTHYIRRGQVGAMDRIRAKRLEAGAELKDVDKSSLMREAIDLLVKQEKV